MPWTHPLEPTAQERSSWRSWRLGEMNNQIRTDPWTGRIWLRSGRRQWQPSERPSLSPSGLPPPTADFFMTTPTPFRVRMRPRGEADVRRQVLDAEGEPPSGRLRSTPRCRRRPQRPPAALSRTDQGPRSSPALEAVLAQIRSFPGSVRYCHEI